jgi:hypothetical protein
LIGYSVELAFPALQDFRHLVHLFARAGILPPVSVLRVLVLVQQNLGSFGPRFQSAYAEFEIAVRERDPLRYRLPFWSVVLEAARLAGTLGEASADRPHKLELALESGLDCYYRIVPFFPRHHTN